MSPCVPNRARTLTCASPAGGSKQSSGLFAYPPKGSAKPAAQNEKHAERAAAARSMGDHAARTSFSENPSFTLDIWSSARGCGFWRRCFLRRRNELAGAQPPHPRKGSAPLTAPKSFALWTLFGLRRWGLRPSAPLKGLVPFGGSRRPTGESKLKICRAYPRRAAGRAKGAVMAA